MNSPFAIPLDDTSPLGRARLSLEGLSLGDAFGERFFVSSSPPSVSLRRPARRAPQGSTAAGAASIPHADQRPGTEGRRAVVRRNERHSRWRDGLR